MYILKEIKTFIVPTKKKKNLDEKIGAFSVIIDNITAGNEIIKRAIGLGLSMPKLGDINPTKHESTLTFFYKGDYDMEYVDSAEESIARNLVPRLSAKNEKYTIFRKLRQASEEKRALRKVIGVRGKTLRQLVRIEKEVKKQYVNYLTTPVPVKKVKKVCACERTFIDVCTHYVQIGTQFIAKNPNDKILLKVR